jgi:HAD superfamily hydrolase (TIGR01450 family)
VRLDDVRGFVFDVDGTLVHRAGEAVHVQPGAREALAKIKASGRPLVVFTNGSHLTPQAFAAGLRAVGLPIEDDELLTPLRSVQAHLRANGQTSMLLFGTDEARGFLADAGVRVVDGDDAAAADVVFVAAPEAFDFARLERAAFTILDGAPLLTASFAPAYAGANGPILSRGAMVTAALAKATGARPVVVGKPSRAALRTIRDHVGAPTRQLAVIGDDATMDVALGRMGGSRTVLVRSGISGPVEIDELPRRRRPDAVVDGIAELLDWL